MTMNWTAPRTPPTGGHQKKILVETKTAAELQSLDAGSWFDPKYAGTRIPLLAEALDTIQQGSVTLIERKGGPPADCIRLLREKNLINKVVVQSFDWEYLRAFHEQEPEQVLGALGPTDRLSDGSQPGDRTKELSAAWLDELQKTGAKVVVWSDKVSREAVQLAHQRGLRVWVYTIDDPAQANELLDMGVDGIITNNPSLIRKAIAQRGYKPLSEHPNYLPSLTQSVSLQPYMHKGCTRGAQGISSATNAGPPVGG